MALPNIQHSSKWICSFSNIPTIQREEDLRVFDQYVRSFSFPDISLNIVKSNFRNYEIQHQVSHANDELNTISITFKISEDLINYYRIYMWLQSMKYGINLNKNEKNDPKELFRLNTIKAITLSFLDNEARTISKFVFNECFVTSVTSIELTQGTEDELEFTLTISYENIVNVPVEGCYDE